MRLPTLFAFIVGVIGGYIVFSGHWELSHGQVMLLGLGCFLLILLVEWGVSRLRRKKKEARKI
jgi:hypothetical protein